MNYANLKQANLSGANILRARLFGTRLNEAIWIDGKVCKAPSIGACR